MKPKIISEEIEGNNMSREGKSRYRTMVLILIIGVLVGYMGAQIMPLSRFFRKPLPKFSVRARVMQLTGIVT